MSKMDKKQQKAKKREEKAKRVKSKHVEEKASGSHLSTDQKRMGKMELFIFFAVALAGALFLIFGAKYNFR